MADLGEDCGAIFDIGAGCERVSGRTALAQSIARRWITEPGELYYAPNFGFGLIRFVSGAIQSIASIAPGLANEARKDERVEDIAVTVQFDRASEMLTVDAVITDAAGPFDMTFALNTRTLTVEQLTVGA